MPFCAFRPMEQTDRSSAPGQGLRSPDKRRLLFVDVEPAILLTLKILLRDKAGVWDMQFVGSGALALEQVKAWHPDVIVSDLILPGMDGLELLRQARLVDPSVLCIILSGPSLSELLDPMADGFAQYLRKPFKVPQLVAAIDLAKTGAP